MATDKQVDPAVARDRDLLINARAKGKGATLGAFVKLSGPGWLQSAITLGGGSLAGSLYLGVISGYSLIWIQPLAMIMGVIMLSAIGYVVLSTGKRPFQAINEHVNPVLGWGWALATLMANMVWVMPQFSLGTAAVQQNLMPSIFGAESAMGGTTGKIIICAILLILCTSIVWSYDKGSKGIKLFEIFLKVLVAVIVISFFGVVVVMTKQGALNWGQIMGHLVPDLNLLTSPASTFNEFIAATGDRFQGYWTNVIVSQQRDVMITAAATAVGINMTFLLPYSMLKKGWDSNFRGLAIFDLATGMFIPFMLVTGCVLIASASQFHTTPAPGLLGEVDDTGALIAPNKSVISSAMARVKFEVGDEAFSKMSDTEKNVAMLSLPEADKKLAAMLAKRDADSLANALEPLTGQDVAQVVFGVGVLGMAVSTIIILMLINGFVVCEIMGRESSGWPYRLACALPGIGVLGPFFWSKAAFWLAVPTSVFGMVLLPVAYFSFFLMMNSKALMGQFRPQGVKRLVWNLLMAIAAGLATIGCLWSVWSKLQYTGLAIVGGFILLALIVQFARASKK